MAAPAPVVAREESVPDFTVRAAAAGILFGLGFGAANASLGRRVGAVLLYRAGRRAAP